MKNFIFIFCLFFLHVVNAQESAKGVGESNIVLKGFQKESFKEWNFGVAIMKGSNFPFPGGSYLWGATFINEKNFIIEYQYGFALPTLLTGKLGIGKRFKKTEVVVGVRPLPFNVYGQTSFVKGKEGDWIVSFEFNPMSNVGLSKAIFNVGYRWDLATRNN
ncbi:MAG: hypothetical protein HON66_03745 [Formosa sp.]|nr:hypothetical protein [Formosa sp.]